MLRTHDVSNSSPNGSGNAARYVRNGSQPTSSDDDCLSNGNTTVENDNIHHPQAHGISQCASTRATTI